MAVDLLAFPFVGGRTTLNFVATLGKRRTAKVERLGTPEDLARWAGLAGLGTISASAADLETARALREALYALTMSALGQADPRPADVELVNSWAAQETAKPALSIRSGTLHRADPEVTVSAVLAAVARDGIELLTGPEAASIRECEDSTCTLLFVDTSRGRRRRWCSMNVCGARAKMRTLRTAT